MSVFQGHGTSSFDTFGVLPTGSDKKARWLLTFWSTTYQQAINLSVIDLLWSIVVAYVIDELANGISVIIT